LLGQSGMASDRDDSPNRWALAFLIPALVFLAALLLGCATPRPIVRLEPNTQDIVWVGGRASVQQESEGIRVAAAFEQQRGDALGVRVEVHNGTEERLEVGPQKIWYSACTSPAVETCSPSRKVIDPEAMIAAIDEKRSVEVAEVHNSQARLGALVLLSAAGDIAQVASGRADRTTGLGTATSASWMESDATRRGAGLSGLEAQRQSWSNEALRRNTLFPAQGTSGEVFFPIVPDARFVWLQLRVGTQRFVFHFRQTVREVRPEPTGGGSIIRNDNR
jgi:hypothetical protein